MKNRTVKVDYLARVEGEGGIFVKIKGDKIEDAISRKRRTSPRASVAFVRLPT